MKRIPKATLLVALMGLFAGCEGVRGPEHVELAPVSQQQAPPRALEPTQAPAQDPWAMLGLEVSSGKTRYLEAEDAKTCPRLKVESAAGTSRDLQPDRQGMVSLIVFWSADFERGRLTVRHVQNLADMYRAHQVASIGIVEKTPAAPRAAAFAEQVGVTMPLYYDDGSALRKMARQMDAVPELVGSVFIIDRHRRLRFFRAGAPLVSKAWGESKPGMGDQTRPGQEEISEAAPEGSRIEDYLRTILRER